MKAAHEQFKANLNRARDLVALEAALEVQTTEALHKQDLLRAAVVLAVSAFDHFVHELARIGMLESFKGQRKATEAFNRFQVSLTGVLAYSSLAGSIQWLEQEIRDRHSWLSFQDPDKVADAIRLVSPKKLWGEVGAVLGQPAADAKARLRLVVERRNKIAHEADMDPTSLGARWPIDVKLVNDAISTIEETASAIFAVVTAP